MTWCIFFFDIYTVPYLHDTYTVKHANRVEFFYDPGYEIEFLVQNPTVVPLENYPVFVGKSQFLQVW